MYQKFIYLDDRVFGHFLRACARGGCLTLITESLWVTALMGGLGTVLLLCFESPPRASPSSSTGHMPCSAFSTRCVYEGWPGLCPMPPVFVLRQTHSQCNNWECKCPSRTSQAPTFRELPGIAVAWESAAESSWALWKTQIWGKDLQWTFVTSVCWPSFITPQSIPSPFWTNQFCAVSVVGGSNPLRPLLGCGRSGCGTCCLALENRTLFQCVMGGSAAVWEV